MASPSPAAEGIPSGQAKASTPYGDYNNIAFAIQQALSRLQTATLVRIESCTNDGGLSPVGFVDVTPLVNQLDSANVATPHVTIHNVPYFRLQGGANAVIIDPEVGDVGLACFASRDLTKVKKTKKQADPGSFRQYSFSDALYVGGLLNAAPTQYVQFNAAGIKIHSPTLIKLEAPDIQLEAETVEINATTSTTVVTPVFVLNAATSATITTALFTVNGATMLNGPVTQGTGSGGGDMQLQGPLHVINTVTSDTDVVSATISLRHHEHPGGTPTGPPIP